jgi:hypothetical protein
MLAMALVSAAIINAQAQQLPDAGSLLRENERQQPQLPKPAPQAVPQTPMAKPQGDLRVLVKTFKLTGNALIGEPELQAKKSATPNSSKPLMPSPTNTAGVAGLPARNSPRKTSATASSKSTSSKANLAKSK